MSEYSLEELAEKLNISPEEILFYEQAGLLSSSVNNPDDDSRFDFNGFLKKSGIKHISPEPFNELSDNESSNYEALRKLRAKSSQLEEQIRKTQEFRNRINSVIEKMERKLEAGEECEISDFIEELF